MMLKLLFTGKRFLGSGADGVFHQSPVPGSLELSKDNTPVPRSIRAPVSRVRIGQSSPVPSGTPSSGMELL